MSKAALLVGINYTGTSLQLSGCINDVKNVREMLMREGYAGDDITVLTDNTLVRPTKANILAELIKLVNHPTATQLYFHYSGHGSYVRDTSGDESDGKDECLVPIDHNEGQGRFLIDDEIWAAVSTLNKDRKLFVVLDCCHSGTGMDLCYTLFKRIATRQLVMIPDGRRGETQAEIVMFSGCQDSQTSADAYIDGTYQGALTNAFLATLNERGREGITYEEMVRSLRQKMKRGRYTQIPNLTSGRRLNLTDKVEF